LQQLESTMPTKKITLREKGRPAFVPTAEQRDLVRDMAGLGARYSDICLFVKKADGKPISDVTLTKYFGQELGEGKARANMNVSRSLYVNATSGLNVQAQIFWLKTQARWKEEPAGVELTGKDGAPLNPPSTEVATLEEQRDAMRQVMQEFAALKAS
jgi:hypothetical protein